MPSIRIDAGAHIRGRERDFMSAFNRAVMTALGVEAEANDVHLTLHDASARLVPWTRSERYCLIEIKLLEGRTVSQKSGMRSELVQAVGTFDVNVGDIKMILIDVPKSNL